MATSFPVSAVNYNATAATMSNRSETLTTALISVNETANVPTVELHQRIIEAGILTVISLAALIGNTSLWLVICRDRSLRTTSNGLILCLSTADLLVSAVNMPVTVATILYGYWMLSMTACVVLGFITMTTFIASVMSLGVISINRFVLICYPVHFKMLYTPSRTGLMVLGTWVLSLSLACPPLFGWGEYDYLPGQSFCFCNWKTSFSYTIFMVATCFGGPCSVMTICYIGILRKVRESRRKVQTRILPPERRSLQIPETTAKATPKSTSGKIIKVKAKHENIKEISSNSRSTPIHHYEESDIHKYIQDKEFVHVTSSTSVNTAENIDRLDEIASISSQELERNEQANTQSQTKSKAIILRKGHQEDLRLTITLLVVISVFVICWLPFCVTMFLSVFSPNPVPRAADITTLLLGCFNSSCNPIIYGIMNKRFWEGYKRLYCCICNHPFFCSARQSDEGEQTANQSWRESLQ